MYGYDIETKNQSSQWKLPEKPRPKKKIKSNVKIHITVFFNYNDLVQSQFLPLGLTVNNKYYLGLLQHLDEAIRKKQPELWKNKLWTLDHYYVPAHTSLLFRLFL